MKTFQQLFLIILVLASYSLWAQTHVSGSIIASQTWTTAGSPYIVDNDVTIELGVTLNVQAGTIIKFTDYYDGINVIGTFNAIGTVSNPIIFTSLLDDTHGGDTNGDGNTTIPGPNQWSTIDYRLESMGSMQYCWISYGGGEHSANVHLKNNNINIDYCNISNSGERGIWIGDASPSISNCTFENNITHGIWIEGFDSIKTFNLINNIFNNNNWAVYANLTEEKNDIFLSGNISNGTDINGFGRNGFGMAGTINGDVKYMGQRNFPFIVWNDVTVKENASLDFSAGTTVKFNDYYDGLNIDGTLIAQGTISDSIFFTALADDKRGGDTNGDGAASVPGQDQWSTINYSENGGNGILRYCFVGYGGGEYGANIHANKNDITIDNSKVSNSQDHGIWIGNASPDITNNTISDNRLMGVYAEGFDSLKTFSFTNNSFTNNEWAVYANLTDEYNDIFLSGNTSHGTALNGFGRNGFGMVGSIMGDVNYTGQRNFPFIIWNDVTVKENASLDISAGTTVKFNDYYDGLNIDGTLIAQGTISDSIFFTALADDKRGGDTNGDGVTTVPGPDQWSTINYSEKGGNGLLGYCFVGYGGGEYGANIHANENDITIDNSKVSNSQDNGIWIGNASPDITNNTISNNRLMGVYAEGFDSLKTFSFINNSFVNNEWAVYTNLTDEHNDIFLSGNTSQGTAINGFGRNGFGMAGSIMGNVKYTGQRNFPFVIWNDVTVKENASLDISAGTTVKFNDYYDGLTIDGSLTAQGTVSDSIFFTALADDKRGGDTNGDGAISLPGPDQWSTINYSEKGGNGILRYCFVGYGGGEYGANIHANGNDIIIDNSKVSNSQDHGIWIVNASPDITNNTISNNMLKGIYVNGFDSLKTFSLTNNSFVNNEWALYADLTDEYNDIFLSGNTSQGTAINGFGRNGFGMAGSIMGNVKYTGQRNFPFVIWNDVTVKENASLDISAGTTVKFNDYYDGFSINGSFQAIGTKTDPIVFTAIASDCFGGDTNGDTDTTFAKKGEWSGIYFHAPSTNNILRNVVVANGGGEGGVNIGCFTNDLTIDSSLIFNSNYYGIYIDNSSPMISNNVISDHSIGIYTKTGAQPQIINNNFSNNKIFSLQNVDGSIFIDATNNFWGANSGPYNPNINPDGAGDPISDFIDFVPWLTEAGLNITDSQPKFSFIVDGRTVSFTNESSKGTRFIWDLGDETTEILNNPFHTYEKPGDYQVCLESAGSDCLPTEKICKTISIKGISSFLPKMAGNIGLVSLTIVAGDLDENTQFVIRDNGTQYVPEGINIFENGSARVTFDLTGIPIGNKDIIVIYGDGSSYMADTRFQVVVGFESTPELQIIGRDAALVNTWTKYEVKITNPGNVDMFGIPIWMAFTESLDFDIEFLNIEFVPSKFSLDNGYDKAFFSDLEIFIVVDSMFGEPNHSRVYPLFIPHIPAGQDLSFIMRIKSSENYVFQAWLNDPYFSNDLNRSPETKAEFLLCLASIFGEKLIEFVPGVDCANTIIGSIYKPLAGIQSKQPKVFVWPSMWNYAQIALECGKTAVTSFKMAFQLVKLFIDFKEDISAIIACKDNFDPKKKKKKPINTVQSFDPNEKLGPTGIEEAHYLPQQSTMSYTVFFENHPDSAEVPAHTVLILDTLDLSVFDIFSLRFNQATVGDSSVQVSSGSRRFTSNIHLSALNVDARINAKVDTITGIVEVIYLSLDPITGDEIEDPYVGLLPPNVNKPEGEGSISFTIDIKQPLTDGMSIENKAWIYFDGNKPIETNNYSNTFDLINPQSEVATLDPYSQDSFLLEWSGEDQLSGIDYFEIWVSIDNQPYINIKNTPSISDIFIGEIGKYYRFYSIAIDKTGNKEAIPNTPDAETTCVVGTSQSEFLLKDIQLQPNPAQEVLLLSFNNNHPVCIDINITDMFGRIVHSVNSTYYNSGANFNTINLQEYQNGLYFLIINMDDSFISRKFIISK